MLCCECRSHGCLSGRASCDNPDAIRVMILWQEFQRELLMFRAANVLFPDQPEKCKRDAVEAALGRFKGAFLQKENSNGNS